MTEADSPEALLGRLRAGVDCDATDPATQRLFEAWAARDHWCARSEALPLLVGVAPAAWTGHLARHGLADAEQALWPVLARGLSLDAAADQSIEPRRLRTWVQDAGLRLPAALARLLDFISSVLPKAAEGGDTVAADEVLRAQERETILGAALMLVTRQAAECVDEEGRYDSARIARLIRARALLWFPLAPPSLSEADMEALIARWVEHGGRR